MLKQKSHSFNFSLYRTEFSTPAVNFGNVHPSDVLDMPVDPNEPTYCLCHQVSYGEMIGCDNTDVSYLCSLKCYLNLDFQRCLPSVVDKTTLTPVSVRSKYTLDYL